MQTTITVKHNNNFELLNTIRDLIRRLERDFDCEIDFFNELDE